MAQALRAVPSKNFVQTTLSSGLSAGVTASVSLASVTGIQNLPGVFVIDRVNGANVETPSKREVIKYTAVSGSTLTTLTRNADSSGTDQDHAVGAVVEFVPDVLWAQSVYDALTETVTASTGAIDGSKVTKVTSNDAQLPASTSNIQVNGADPKRGIYVPASAMYPSSTAGCATLTQVETSTNKVNVKVLDFDGAGTSKEFAEFGLPSPLYWDASTVTAQFVWYASAGSGTVNWEIQGGAFSDDDALDAAYGTLQEVTDTLLATGDVHISPITSAATIAGTPVAGDWVMFRVARDPANDTDTSDARLLGVIIRFGISQYNDV